MTLVCSVSRCAFTNLGQQGDGGQALSVRVRGCGFLCGVPPALALPGLRAWLTSMRHLVDVRPHPFSPLLPGI